jgi:uncharacterized OB-fold protein
MTAAGPAPPAASKYLERELDGAAQEFYRRLASGTLATTSCASCGLTEFPPRDRCPRCGVGLVWVELPRQGRLHAFTTQETALRFGAPAVLAVVETGPAVVPGICEGAYAELSIGQRVRIEIEHAPAVDLHLLAFLPEDG